MIRPMCGADALFLPRDARWPITCPAIVQTAAGHSRPITWVLRLQAADGGVGKEAACKAEVTTACEKAAAPNQRRQARPSNLPLPRLHKARKRSAFPNSPLACHFSRKRNFLACLTRYLQPDFSNRANLSSLKRAEKILPLNLSPPPRGRARFCYETDVQGCHLHQDAR